MSDDEVAFTVEVSIRHDGGAYWVYVTDDGKTARVGPATSLDQTRDVSRLIIDQYRKEYEPHGATVSVVQKEAGRA